MGVNGIYGLSGSGMDIESMVKVGMMSKQNEYDKMAQKYTKNEWMKADYLELSNKITTFNSSTLSQYKMSNTMNAKSVESSSAAVKVSANASADLMNHSVDVLSLSSNAYLVGTNSMTRYAINGASSADQTSIRLADVLFSDLQTTTKADGKTYVYGTIAPTDMEDDSRDYGSYAGADGKKIGTVWNFGKEDGALQTEAAHWTNSSTGTTWADDRYVTTNIDGTGTNQTYLPDDSLKSYTSTNNDWRWRERAGEQYWLVKDDSVTNGWRKVLDPRTDSDDWASFQNFVQEKTGFEYVPYKEWTPVATEVGNLDFNDDDTKAFSFTISDGVTTNDDGTLKEVTISYSYKQLLGDGDTEGVTFNDLVRAINNSGLNIKANYDADHDRFSFYNSKSGDENGIKITLGGYEDYRGTRSSLATRNFFNNMGLYQSKNGVLYGKGGVEASEDDKNALTFNIASGSSDGTNSFMGENGKIKIDGVTYNDVIDNKLTVGGITYTALSTTTTTDSAGNVTGSNPATVSVSQDVDGIVDKVKSFITDYNKLLASLYEKYDEKPDSNYKPLTQSQKDQMKEEQITKWEEKAKAGLLYHDQTLGKIIMNMRSAVTDTVEGVDGKYNSVFSLGVSTTGIKGQLVLDEDKLRKALSEDSDAVYNVFAKLDSANLDDSAKSGVAQRLGDIFNSATKTIKDRAGSSSDITEDSDLNNLLRNLQTKMSNFKKLMSSFETALYKKYDAMESTLAKLGTQLNYVMGSTGQ